MVLLEVLEHANVNPGCISFCLILVHLLKMCCLFSGVGFKIHVITTGHIFFHILPRLNSANMVFFMYAPCPPPRCPPPKTKSITRWHQKAVFVYMCALIKPRSPSLSRMGPGVQTAMKKTMWGVHNGCGSKLNRRGKPQVLANVSTYQGSILGTDF